MSENKKYHYFVSYHYRDKRVNLNRFFNSEVTTNALLNSIEKINEVEKELLQKAIEYIKAIKNQEDIVADNITITVINFILLRTE